MKFSLRQLLAVGVLAISVLPLGARTAAHHNLPTGSKTQAYVALSHHMVADGDIGDGTSPTRKG